MSTRSFDDLEREVAALRDELGRLDRRRRSAWHRRLVARLAQPRVRNTLALALVVMPLAAYAVTIPNLFMNGQVADADQVNANFAALAAAQNAHEPDPTAHHAKTTSATELTSGTLADARLSANVSLLGPAIAASELAFNPATQLELDTHAGAPSVHHAKTLDAGELLAGTLADARLSPNVSLLGPTIAAGELAFDTATQSELNAHSIAPSAHHARYTNAEAVAAVGPHAALPNRILVAPAGGDFTSIQAAINSVAPSASSPYRIDIAPGTYTEELTLKSHIHLRGASRAGTVIDPVAPGGSHITLSSLASVKLSQLTVRDLGLGKERALSLFGSDLELNDVRIEGYFTELILATTGSTLRADNSEFVDPSFAADRGIRLVDSEAVITRSLLETRDCAIEAERSALTLTTSEVKSLEVCTLGFAATPPTVLIENNRLHVVRIDGNARAKIVGNDISGEFGRVTVTGTEPAQVTGNRIATEDTIAIVIDSGSQAEIVGNRIEGLGFQTTGVFNAGTARIVGNSFAVTEHAVVDQGSAIIVGNHASSGDILQSSTSVVIGNTVTAQPAVEGWVNPRGIQIESTSNAVVLEAGGSTVTLAASGAVTIQAAGTLDLTGTNVTISATGELELNGPSQVDVNGGVINLN